MKDVYCPLCLGGPVTMRYNLGDSLCMFECEGCGSDFEHSFHVDDDGWFTWVWDEQHPKPNPGCPWCGTCNIRAIYVASQQIAHFSCRRSGCMKTWRGGWITKDGQTRWKLRVPVESVPWASGTVADLECWRRVGIPGDWTNRYQSFNPACCRWPKSCSAYDPGFRVGNGPTTLPIVWNDGFGWRSGPPNEIQSSRTWDLWNAAKGEMTDDGCGQGCEYICRCT